MTLTARLPRPLDEALDAYCMKHGVTKSYVVQEALAEYLVRPSAEQAEAQGEVSETYRALKKAGLIGCVRGDGVSATKEVVRQRVLDSLNQKRRA